MSAPITPGHWCMGSSIQALLWGKKHHVSPGGRNAIFHPLGMRLALLGVGGGGSRGQCHPLATVLPGNDPHMPLLAVGTH